MNLPGDGGNMMFVTGRAASGGTHGDFVWLMSGTAEGDEVEVMRIKSDGTFLVKGKPVENDRELYLEFRLWLLGSERTE